MMQQMPFDLHFWEQENNHINFIIGKKIIKKGSKNLTNIVFLIIT
jgi:hypothetical protein